MRRSASPSHTEHPVALGSFRSWMQLLGRSSGIDRAYVLRALFVSLTTFLTAPLRLWEWIRHGHSIRHTALHPSPVFVIGHWRSGTTHLHNLLCRDKSFGYLSTFQAMAPGFCIVGDGHIKPSLARLAGKRYPTRLIDNIPLAFDAPQEDEFAMASLSPRSFLHGFTFPRQARDFFERYVMFEPLSDASRKRWVETYCGLLRKATFLHGGKRLAIKNCAHSGRIRTLLELFPDARFIHIHRDPYEVFVSTLHMHQTVLPRSQLQSIDSGAIRSNVLLFYRMLMKRLLDDWDTIPPAQRVEVRFEDLERAPIAQLERIYDTLGLPDFADALPAFEQYLSSIDGYRKNAYEFDEKAISEVDEHWSLAFEELGYARRGLAPGEATA
jgi:omega-hydroxy-beta-dihydromenaquinone-9 sulfotransferase